LRILLDSVRYALPNALLLAFIAALAHGGWPIWAMFVFVILVGGVIDEAVGDDDGVAGPCNWSLADVNLYLTLPLLVAMTVLMLRLLPSASAGNDAPFVTVPLIGAVLGSGYFYALAGATAAHELTHRPGIPVALVCARILMAFTLNPSFEIFHVHGHHRYLCTLRDPATARRGEYVLAFVVRTVITQTTEGWRLEAERLRRKGVAVWSLQNRVLGGIACSLAILAAAVLMAGPAGGGVVLAAGIVGRLIHEMVNYVQHYGIVRAEGAPIEMRHAWDCERRISNVLLYNLPRHADHHQFAAKPFWALTAPAESPKLPFGYQTMSAISLIPPWWHAMIDPLLADWDQRLANDAERSLVRERGWAIKGSSAAPAAEMRMEGHDGG
jgi:alkane 1-monooxygenase